MFSIKSIVVALFVSLFPFSIFAGSSRVIETIAKYDNTIKKMKADFSSQPQDPQDIQWIRLKIQYMVDVDHVFERIS